MEFENFINEIKTNFEKDIDNAIQSLDKFIRKIPATTFSKRIDFVAKYDNKVQGIIIFINNNEKDFETLVKSNDYSYCEAVFTNAFKRYFNSNTDVSKLEKVEPELTPDLKDFCILYEFYIDKIFTIPSNIFNTKKQKEKKNETI